jgi:hypothetical protein
MNHDSRPLESGLFLYNAVGIEWITAEGIKSEQIEIKFHCICMFSAHASESRSRYDGSRVGECEKPYNKELEKLFLFF